MFNKHMYISRTIIKVSLAGLLGSLLLITSTVYVLSQMNGVEIGPSHTRKVTSGQVITYDHILTNTTTFTDTFALEAHSTQDWSVGLLGGIYPTGTILLPLQVGAQTTASFQISLTVPVNANGITDITVITATSQTSPTVWNTTADTTIVLSQIYLPLVLRRWPPIPYQPTLDIIQGVEDGNYTTSWAESPSRLADTYILQEAKDSDFTIELREVCTTAQQSCNVSGKVASIYYYRVRGHNGWGYGGWSNIQSANVSLPDTPTLNLIDNIDGDGNFTVSWDAIMQTTGYRLEEDTTSSFSNPVTVYNGDQISWTATNKLSGTYYYRVRGNGPTGQSEWSNIQSATVPPPPPTLGDGFYLVGSEIKSGKWHSTSTGDSCYWARYDSNQNILDNHFGLAGGTVNVRQTDYEIEFHRCGVWEYVEFTEEVLLPNAAESKGDGFYTVGVEIVSGRWHSTGTGDSCYWARLDSYQDILDNHFGQAGGTVTIRDTDYEVEFHRCGTWVFLGS